MIHADTPASDSRFELFLFYRDDESARAAEKAGIDGIVVDLEHVRKASRQAGFDTEINRHDLSTVTSLRSISDSHILCRVDHSQPLEPDDFRRVIDAGADEIILPMVTTIDQAAKASAICSGQVGLTIMIETPQAVAIARDLAQLDATRLYVGLNDLHILRATRHIFAAMADGTLDAIRRDTSGAKLGFGGLTLPECGAPLPARHLFNEMARLDCGFTFLRRSFYRDTEPDEYSRSLQEIRSAMTQARQRSAEERALDFNQLMASLEIAEGVLCA